MIGVRYDHKGILQHRNEELSRQVNLKEIYLYSLDLLSLMKYIALILKRVPVQIQY